MPVYSKIADIVITIVPVETTIPAPYGYVPNSVGFNDGLPTPITTAFDPATAQMLQAFAFEPNGNWSAIETVPLGISVPLFPGAESGVYGANYVAMGGDVMNDGGPPTFFRWVSTEFEMTFDNSQTQNVVPLTAAEIDFEFAPSSFTGHGTYLTALGPTDYCSMYFTRYVDPPYSGTNNFCCAIYSGGVMTAHNAVQFIYDIDNFGAEFVVGNFGAAAPYRLITTTLFRMFEMDWTPEPFGGDAWSGTYNNTVPAEITFDDPVVQMMVDTIAPDWYIPNHRFVGRAQMLLGYTDVTYTFLEIFGETREYNVLSAPGILEQIGALYNLGYSWVIGVYDPTITTMYLYAIGLPVEPGPQSIPVFIATKLPCFVNCIPLIDRRK